MRLVRFADGNRDPLGVERDGRVNVVESPSMDDLIGPGRDGIAMLGPVRERAAVARAESSLSVEHLSLLSPIRRPGKIVAVGINYAAHAAEGGRPAAADPVLFAKFPTSVIGPGDDIVWDPALTSAVDYEAELAVVIGRTCRRVDESTALDYVLGYTCLNDVSARDLQFADKQFVRSKSLDTFCPIGPVLVTPDEIPDPQALRIRSYVNGELRQDASTADMIHGVAELIAFCSRAFTLESGDVIATGTPAGVGWYREPKALLHDGDEVVIEIEGIGRLVNRCREEPTAGAS